jgi:hypothetical protein
MAVEEFDGRDVIEVEVRVTNTGDGLSHAMKFDPVLHHHGERVRIILDGEVDHIDYQRVKNTTYLKRVETVKAEGGMFVDSEVVEKMLNEHTERIATLEEEAKGKARLKGQNDEDPLGVFGGSSTSEPSEEEKALVAEEEGWETPPPPGSKADEDGEVLPPPASLAKKRASKPRKTTAKVAKS